MYLEMHLLTLVIEVLLCITEMEACMCLIVSEVTVYKLYISYMILTLRL